MDATTVIAIYAAFVASAAALVQYLQWRSSRTELRVHVFGGTAPVLPVEAGSSDRDHQEERAQVLFIQIINRSPHPVKITNAWLGSKGRRNPKVVALGRPFPADVRFPIEIAARDNQVIWLRRSKLEEDWKTRRLHAQVSTAAGDRFNSEAFRLAEIGSADMAL